MISHRHITAWPEQLEDVYDEIEADEPWFKNFELESDELIPADESSLYRPGFSRRHATRSAFVRSP